jgi:methionine-rich copper-binding protein CopC
MVLTGTLPPDVQLAFVTWLTQNYSTLAVSAQQQTTIKTMQFTLQRNQTSMVLDIVPSK